MREFVASYVITFLLLTAIYSFVGTTVDGEPSYLIGPMIVAGFITTFVVLLEFFLFFAILAIKVVWNKIKA